jgi:hypothetical protein
MKRFPSATLPTGQVMDGKNTLQSFEAPNTTATLQDPPEMVTNGSVRFTLPDGALITGKNTLQSFDAVDGPNHQRTPMDPPDALAVDDIKPLLTDAPPPNPAAAPPSTTVVAIAVETDLVYAELAPEPVSSYVPVHPNGNPHGPVAPTTTPWYQSRSTVVWLTVTVLALLVVVLGVSLGWSSSSSSNSSSSNEASGNGNGLPTMAPIFASVPTVAPIAEDPNITLRAAVLTSYINNITLSNQTIASNGTSPESQALSWLIYNDTLLETAAVISTEDPISSNAVGFRIRQRYALLTMWFQQTDTAKWAITTGWLVDLAECAWYGVSCKPFYINYFDDDSFYGGSENAVTQVSFNPLIGSYVGVIPSDIGLLTTLEHFEIQNSRDFNNANGRYLLGSLPDSIGQWTALTYFDVSGNALTGTLPDSIGQLTALTYFDISINFDLNGTLPDSIDQWAALSYFDIYSNALTGTLPDGIGQWTALTYFDIGYNFGLNGTLPDSIGQWTALTYFNANSNALSGTLPESIGQWTALTYFDVAPNTLNGTIPSSIGNWSLIEIASFSGNQLVGTMPNAICQYIDPNTDALQVDCTVNCTCCTTECFS